MKHAELQEKIALQKEFNTELVAIADWWSTHAIDQAQGGFYGEVDINNQPHVNASKGIILNARILWFFSAVAIEIDNPMYAAHAKRAYDYIQQYFYDATHGGYYWEVNAHGEPINTKKQVYAQAFTLYALCEYFKLTQEPSVLTQAIDCFNLIERKTIDAQYQGYLEAFTQTWAPIDDLRLSEKDLNFPKSQNTHLHVLEAYTNLYDIHPTPAVYSALKYTVDLFDQYMIDKHTYHLRMFMDLQWQDHSPGFTFGHDIEASWLIAKAVNLLGDANYQQQIMPSLIKIAQVTLQEAIGAQGQVMDAFNFKTQTINADNVWWVQAEALVGFLFAYEQTQQKEFYNAAKNVWSFIKTYQIDSAQGEWLWLSSLDNKTEQPFYKAGFWKCPYHNGRAMIEASLFLQ
jgi:mannobiose 2-epimerase